MFIGLSIFSLIIPNLILNYTSYMFCLFLGFIIPSIYTTWKDIKNKSNSCYIYLILGIIACISISMFLQNSSTALAIEDNYPNSIFYFFIAGFIAISAMLLPGISGSYILLILGVYFHIINTFKSFIISLINFIFPYKSQNHLPLNESFFLLSSFAIGCCLGIAVFSKIINYFLTKYKKQTLSFLTGIISGSLYALYPFKLEKISSVKEFTSATNTLPPINLDLGISVLLFTLAVTISIFLLRFSSKKI